MSRAATPMIGRRFGLLTVVRLAGRTAAFQPRYLCVCDCGSEVERIGCALRHAVKMGQRPNCGCSRRRRGPARQPSPLRRGRVTLANYREAARGFDARERLRLAEILRRHDRASCCFCSKRRACPVAAEAVEVVLLEPKYGLTGERPEPWEEIDYTKQGAYTR